MTYKASKGKADELTTRNDLEEQRLTIARKGHPRAVAATASQGGSDADAWRKLRRKQLNDLKVRAGIDGVLVDMPLQVGQHVAPGHMLARVIQPNHLIAELKIAETQARDVQIGEPASVDTHNGIVYRHGDARRSGSTERNGHG